MQQRLLHFRSKIYRNILCAINIEISTVLMFGNFLRVWLLNNLKNVETRVFHISWYKSFEMTVSIHKEY